MSIRTDVCVGARVYSYWMPPRAAEREAGGWRTLDRANGKVQARPREASYRVPFAAPSPVGSSSSLPPSGLCAPLDLCGQSSILQLHRQFDFSFAYRL